MVTFKLLKTRTILLLTLLSFLIPLTAGAGSSDLYIAQGIEAINAEKYGKALELLEKALALSPDDPEAVYYAGVAASRLGRFANAERYLSKALQLDPTAASVHYELGRVFYLDSRCKEAAGSLSQYLSLAGEGELADQARGMMESCGEEAAEKKAIEIHLFLGGQYDSNVILEQENPLVPADQKDDYRGVVYVAAEAAPYRSRALEVTVDYNFYQSVHTDLNEFDVHHHTVSPQIELFPSKPLRPAVGYSFEYTLFGGEKYSQFHAPFGKITLGEGEHFTTEVLYQYRDQTYWDTDLFPDNAVRSGSRNRVEVKQKFTYPKVSGFLYGSGDFDRADEDFWSFDGWAAGARAYFQVADPLHLTLAGEYGERNFKEDFPGLGEKREDRIQVYSVGLNYQITDRFGLYLIEDYTIHESNLEVFDYKRSVTSLFLTVGLL